MQPEVIIIAALAGSTRVIGKRGKLPWPAIPEDLQRFQSLTRGHPVIMGRITWELDLEKVPLPERLNIVISRQEGRDAGPVWVASLEAAIAVAQGMEKVFIVGGATLYTQALATADTLELTVIEGEYAGDTFFRSMKVWRRKSFV